jgi:hypothetical protein
MRGLRFLTLICAFSIALVAASNPFLGSWKLNNAKSKFAGTEMKEMTVVFTAVGDKVKRVANGIDGDGEPIHESSTIAWDGKDHAIDAPGLTVAVSPGKRVLDVTVKREGKVIDQIRAVVSRNGKTTTITEKGEDEKGRKIDSVEVFEKQ